MTSFWTPSSCRSERRAAEPLLALALLAPFGLALPLLVVVVVVVVVVPSTLFDGSASCGISGLVEVAGEEVEL